MHYAAIIIGGGPAGLACAGKLAEKGLSTLILERKQLFGPKVCAGGITWSGLIRRVPPDLIEQSFPVQHICTPWQHSRFEAAKPIIATVNRQRLGRHMADKALAAGADLRTSCQVRTITEKSITFYNSLSGREETATFDILVGADGATSVVRKYLSLPTERLGVGINYQVPGRSQCMEWHLDWSFFKNGYGWIFPHSDTISIGAYGDKNIITAADLKSGLLSWAKGLGYNLGSFQPRAELVSYDFRGWNFGNVFLIGEAAGLASGLTGEGIYPAIVSGEEIACYIANKNHCMKCLERLIRMHRLHSSMVNVTGRNRFLSRLIMELVTFFLRTGILDFRKLEMAH